MKWGWEWVWWISLFHVCAEMKNSRGASSSSSSLLSHSFSRENECESRAGCKTHLLKAKATVWSAAHLLFSDKKCLLLLFFMALIYDWSSHLIYHEWVCVSLSSKCCDVSLQPKIIRAGVWVHQFRPHTHTRTHTHTHTHTHTPKHTLSHTHSRTHMSRVGISLRPCLPTSAGHFNDVTF